MTNHWLLEIKSLFKQKYMLTSGRYLIAANGEQDVLFGDLEARGEHGFEVSLVPVLPKAGHLASAGHLHAEHHVSSGQPRE